MARGPSDHQQPTRQGSRHRRNAPYQRVQTKDGYPMVGAAGEAIGRVEPRFWGTPNGAGTRALRPIRRAWLTATR